MRVRGVRRLAAVTALLAAAPAALAADLRIGYIDSARIFEQYTVAKEAQKRFDQQVQAWREEAAEKERAVNALRAELKDHGPILSAPKRQEKEEALQKAIGEHERFIQDIWGPSGRAVAENDRLTRDIVNRIREVVEKLATEKGYQLVLDAASGFVIYADREMDLTAQVVAELNAQAGTGTTTPR